MKVWGYKCISGTCRVRDVHKYNMKLHNLIECLFYYRWPGVIGLSSAVATSDPCLFQAFCLLNARLSDQPRIR